MRAGSACSCHGLSRGAEVGVPTFLKSQHGVQKLGWPPEGLGHLLVRMNTHASGQEFKARGGTTYRGRKNSSLSY